MVSSGVLGQSPFQLNYFNTSVPTVSLYADISKWYLLRQYAIRSRPVNIQSRSPSNICLSRDPCQGPPVSEETCRLPSLTDRKCRARRMEGLIGRASRLDQSERSRRTRGLRCRGGGISGHDAIKGLSMFPPKNIRPPPSAIPGNG